MSVAKLDTALKDKLKQLIRPKDKIRVVAGAPENYAGSFLRSNFNGIPYLEQDEKWPINLQTRRPLDFVFQIINDDNLLLPPYIKVLQFYYDWEMRPTSWKQEGWLIKVYPELDESKSIQLDKTPKPQFCSVNYKRGYALPSWESLDVYDSEIVSLCRQVDQQIPWEVYEKHVQELIGQSEIKSFIGGYPQWIQGDVTPTFGSYRSKLLIQIDSEELADINWGTMGSLYLFYHPLKMYDFGFVIQNL